jgi:hypothetical protein
LSETELAELYDILDQSKKSRKLSVREAAKKFRKHLTILTEENPDEPR